MLADYIINANHGLKKLKICSVIRTYGLIHSFICVERNNVVATDTTVL
ncbi:MAG: hypothetical protein LBB41_05925 [Prevotellaceae bacterium]|jgi:hypothetical protein|nr:hypothetical protein [Prevotellaceae bacterium]